MFATINPRFTTEQWPVRKLVELHEARRINLSPHYQRNSIWSLASQRSLIATVLAGNAIPNFFVRAMPYNKWEMVDGQQRSRSILGYWYGEFSDKCRLTLTDAIKSEAQNARAVESFLDYRLSVTILDRSYTDKEVEDFYVLVNSSGLRLNRPELFKAEYYSTKFLKLATELAGSQLFESMALFSEKSSDRMNDIDFVSELLALLELGFSDKKEKVDSLYASDISEAKYNELKQRAENTLNCICPLNDVTPINRTRFKQKGDFYTLFGFISQNTQLSGNALANCYKTILRLSPHIRPSQEQCDPLMEYAVNCVTQSNSKKAREGRNQFFCDLFLNREDEPNATQSAIAEFLGLDSDGYERLDGYLVIKVTGLSSAPEN